MVESAKGKPTLHFNKRPSPWTTLWHVFRGGSFSFDENRFENIEAIWPKADLDKSHLKKYLDICAVTAGDTFPVFYQMTRIFSLLMRVLGHRKDPLSVLRTLNTEETVPISRLIKSKEEPTIKCELSNYRYVKNGLEVDICGRVMVGGKTVFKTVKSFLYRGKFDGPVTGKPPLEKMEKGREVTRWVIPGKVGFRFGLLSGDTNAIHYLPRYARLQGFERDFARPILVMETCLQNIEAARCRSHMKIESCVNKAATV